MSKKINLLSLSLFMLFLFSRSILGQEKAWTLEDCINYAMKNDYLLKERALNEEFYEKQVMGAYGRLLPGASLYADNQYNFGSVIDPTTNARISSDIRSNSFSLSTSVDLFNWGNFVRIKSAKLQKDKAKYDLEIAKNELIIKIVQAFNQVQFDKEQIKLANEQLDNTKIHLKRIERETELGNKAKSDLYEIQANESSDYQTIIAAENALRSSKLALKNLLNLKDNTDFVSEEMELPALILDSIHALYTAGLSVRPEIKSAELQERIRKNAVHENKSNYLPKLEGNYSLSSFYVDTEQTNFGNQFKNNRNHFLGLSINVPLFNQLQTRTAVQQAKIEWEQAKWQSEQQKQAYFSALSDAYTQTTNAYETWQAALKNRDAQLISFEKTEEKFRQNMIDAYGYFGAKNNLLSAETALLQAKFTYHYQKLLLDWYVTNEIAQ